MISVIYSSNTLTKTSGGSAVPAVEYRGLSTDEKPTNCPNGSTFYEMDTGKKYFFDATPDAETPWVTVDE